MKGKNAFATKEDNNSRSKIGEMFQTRIYRIVRDFYCYVYIFCSSNMHKRMKSINSFLQIENVCETLIHFRTLQEYDNVKCKVSTNI